MIEYKKCGLTPYTISLLQKLGEKYPFNSLKLDIENNEITLVKVVGISDEVEIFYGLLVLRGIINRRGIKVLVVDHAIACDSIGVSFGNIIAKTIQDFARRDGFERVRQHADNKGLARMLQKFYGESVEEVFEISVDTPHKIALKELQNA